MTSSPHITVNMSKYIRESRAQHGGGVKSEKKMFRSFPAHSKFYALLASAFVMNVSSLMRKF